jgi:hypothetical protein
MSWKLLLFKENSVTQRLRSDLGKSKLYSRVDLEGLSRRVENFLI